MNEETTPNVTAGVDKAETAGRAMLPAKRKELADSIATTGKKIARELVAKLNTPEKK